VVWFALNEDRPLFAFAGIWTEFEGERGTKAFKRFLDWVDAQRRVKPLKANADSIEKRALEHVPLSIPGAAS